MVLRDVIGQYQDAATPLKTFESGKLHYGNGNPSASDMIPEQILSVTEMMWKLESHGSC